MLTGVRKSMVETLVLLPAHLSVERTRLHTARNRYIGGQDEQLIIRGVIPLLRHGDISQTLFPVKRLSLVALDIVE